MKNKILVYADVTLNIIDGSSVWLINLSKLLANDKSNQVDILLKVPITDDVLTRELEKYSNINLLDVNSQMNQTVSSENINKILLDLDKKNNYSSIIIRGENIIYEAIRTDLASKMIVYLVAFCHDENKISYSEIRNLLLVYNHAQHVLVQTDEMKEYLIKILNVDGKKFGILNPIVFPLPKVEKIPKSMCYAGKLSKNYKIKELLDLMEILYDVDPEIKLYFIGNKVNSDLKHEKNEIITRLIKAPNIVYIPELPNNESRMIVSKCELGYCFRSEEVDNDFSLELSTKFLEYGIAGAPCLVRETKVFKKILGDDYPLFITDIGEAADKIKEYFSSPKDKILSNLENSFKNYDVDIVYKNIKNILLSVGNKSKTSNKSTFKKLFGVSESFKDFSLNVLRNFAMDNEKIILYDVTISDVQDHLVDIDESELFICWDDYYQFPLKNFVYESEYFGKCYKIPAYILDVGIHRVFLKYKNFCSDEIKVFIKNNSNLLGINVWSGSDYNNEYSGIVSGKGHLVESSSHWSSIGNQSLKITRISDSFKWTDVVIGNVYDGDVVNFSADYLNLRYDVVAFFVFFDKDNNQTFSPSVALKPSSDLQSFNISCLIDNSIKKIYLRFLIKDSNGYFYIDNLNAVINQKVKFGVLDTEKLENHQILFKDLAISNDKNDYWYSTVDSVSSTDHGTILKGNSGYYLATNQIDDCYWKDTFVWEIPITIEMDIFEAGNNNSIMISSGVNLINRELSSLGISNFSHVSIVVNKKDCRVYVNNNSDPIVLGHSFTGDLQVGFQVKGSLTYKNFLIYK